MQIIHIIPSLNEEASGPTYSVSRLSESLSNRGYGIKVGCVDFGGKRIQSPIVSQFPIGCGPKKLGRSPSLYNWLNKRCREEYIDIIHNHGLWQINSLYPAWISRKYQIPLVQSPRGAFSEWAMNWGSRIKPMFWKLLQHPALKNVTCFHATAECEYHDIRRLGFRQPVAIIPNGIDLNVKKKKKNKIRKTILFLGRIHPNKGLDMLIPAWKKVKEYPESQNWTLRIVGSDEGNNVRKGYLEDCIKLVKELKVNDIEFMGPLYGENKIEAFKNADLFVLPSYSENFAMTVAESLSVGTPVIVSKGAPWEQLSTYNAGWWIDIGIHPLIEALIKAMRCSQEELTSKGEAGYFWMKNEFSWEKVSAKMELTYKWLLSREKSSPSWIRTD